jgi:hypothetical protein
MYTTVIFSANMQSLTACIELLHELPVIVIHENTFCFARPINTGILAAGQAGMR